MLRKLLLIPIVIAASTATAQTPIPKAGDRCPVGTYPSGDYCKPSSRSIEDGETFITKSGSKCPIGYYSSAGSYCKRFKSSDREVIPRVEGGKCPRGWNTSGRYCVKQ